MPTYEVRAKKTCHTSFTVSAKTRKEAEEAIATQLRSDKELAWTDDLEGVSVACISGNEIWRIRQRFSLADV